MQNIIARQKRLLLFGFYSHTTKPRKNYYLCGSIVRKRRTTALVTSEKLLEL